LGGQIRVVPELGVGDGLSPVLLQIGHSDDVTEEAENADGQQRQGSPDGMCQWVLSASDRVGPPDRFAGRCGASDNPGGAAGGNVGVAAGRYRHGGHGNRPSIVATGRSGSHR